MFFNQGKSATYTNFVLLVFEALLLIAIDYYKALDTAEGYKNCALLKRVLQYYRKKYRRWLPPLSRNKEKLERIKKEYRLRYLN